MTFRRLFVTYRNSEDGEGGSLPGGDSGGGGEESGGFDMAGAVDTIGADLFGAAEDESAPPQAGDEGAPPPTGTAKPAVQTEETPPAAPAGKQPPQSWKKEMQEKYSTLPVEVQDYIVEREEQMRAGLEKDRGDANLGRTMRDVMAPFQAHLQAQGVTEPQAVRFLLTAHQNLSSGSPEQKAAMFQRMAQEYGVDLSIAAAAPAEAVDPAVRALMEKVQGLESHLTASHQRAVQEARQRVAQDVNTFASDPQNPYFDEVSDEIVAFLQAGHALKEAYEKAVWANPVTRAKEVSRLQQEQEKTLRERAQAEAEAARKAASNTVRSRDTRRTPTEVKGSMRDLDTSLRDSLREIKNRAH